VAVARRLSARGEPLGKGSQVQYVVCRPLYRGGAKFLGVDEFSGDKHTADVAFYANFLRRAMKLILAQCADGASVQHALRYDVTTTVARPVAGSLLAAWGCAPVSRTARPRKRKWGTAAGSTG
jgi:hypothetical protein